MVSKKEIKTLSIVIPVFNEKKTLLSVLKRVQDADIGDIKKELVLVDDCSTDGTRDVLNKFKKAQPKNVKIFYHKKNQGKGAAVRTGFKHVTGDVVLIQDADLEYRPEEYPQLLKPIMSGKADVVFGSRFLRRQKSRYKLYALGNWGISLFASLIFFHTLTDVETCYKIFTRQALERIKPTLKAQRFDLEPELAAKVVKNKLRLVEVPISYKCRSFDEGKKITPLDGVKAILYLLKYRFVD